MKFRAHETFFIRKGWLYKGLKNININPYLFSDKKMNAMDILGLGSNMVKSLRYWLQAVGLTEEKTSRVRSQVLTDPIGTVIWENDPYNEELGTLWLLHYRLASNENIATSWYYFFNHFKMTEFNKEDFILGLENYIRSNGESISKSSLEDDFVCIINTYMSRFKLNPEKVNPESNIDSPFGELELIDIVNKKEKIYRKCQPRKENLHPLIVLSVIIDQMDGKKEINLNDLIYNEKNIGKTFNLDMTNIIYYLNEIEKIGHVKFVRTAGLDIVKIVTDMTFKECIEFYYKVINE